MPLIQSDLESIQRLLGHDYQEHDLPKDLLREYLIRLRMFHNDGNNGALGTLALIDMIRFLQYKPEFLDKNPEQPIEWSKVPNNGTFMVEARINGELEWRKGAYMGKCASGSLAVKIQGMEWVQELSIKDVRRPLVVKIADEVAASVGAKTLVEDVAAREAFKSLPPNPIDSAALGDDLWITDGDKKLVGTFQRRNFDGQIWANIEGEGQPRLFPRQAVEYAELAGV